MAPKNVELVAEARAGSADARDELVRRYFLETAAIAADRRCFRGNKP